MVKDFAELDKSHLTVLSCHFNYLSPECLTEGVRGEVLDIFKHILHLDFFQDHIDALSLNDITVAVEKAFLVWVFDVQSRITLLDMFLHTGIDLYLSMFSCLLLDESKTFTEYLFPRKGEKVADAKPEKRAAGNEKAHPIFAIPV